MRRQDTTPIQIDNTEFNYYKERVKKVSEKMYESKDKGVMGCE